MNPSQHPLADGQVPAWAQEWGEDRFGVFVGFRIGDVEHRFRWIPPGSFMMGSPESEQGRDDDEGPQHLVTISEGFWLGQEPCAQELWQEVMAQNPSAFPSPRRPVETVSWQEVKEFLAELNERLPEPHARLPTEAEWEYACRAGTSTSTYAGELKIHGHYNGPLLDAIAWYGGNSGVGFDLDEGADSSGWPEKQYEHTKAGTRELGLKKPNPWGLHDMLGNVYEWCEDAWDLGTGYGGGTRQDPVVREGPDRVIRGGSWLASARDVRAAYRNGRRPGYRHGRVGFRLARGQG